MARHTVQPRSCSTRQPRDGGVAANVAAEDDGARAAALHDATSIEELGKHVGESWLLQHSKEPFGATATQIQRTLRRQLSKAPAREVRPAFDTGHSVRRRDRFDPRLAVRIPSRLLGNWNVGELPLP